ncbi:ammonium transporter [Methylorubrum populi]|uniref:Ammonium transporter n=1 Tax=Methylorubrum rhodesianum TaxID=29427 RepID=A0ABU9ZGH6_9HYPH|nr:ammonium transporter [Methylorubrum rhodesianum]MBK3404217.1 ammonium transporter [Methylorubrum rhodesianum]MBY0143007.1 ammonium transporter [Methylorubrum populi]
MRKACFATAVFCGSLGSFPAIAQDSSVPVLNGADTAFVATCSLFVMLMMLPGLALFYAGMGRSKNVLSILTQVFASAALICVLWTIAGYSLAFDTTGPLQAFIGGTSKMFLSGVSQTSLVGTLPEYLYFLFMMLFAAITPPIIVGAFAERIRFSAVLVFMGVWFFINYVPMAHMAWGGGWVFNMGGQDFAGGNVVHLNAGMAALVAAYMVGPRMGYGTTMMAPHNMTMTFVGGALLWVGWLAFCGGCALVANGFAMLVVVNTLLGGAAGALSWMATEWLHRGRPSTLGVLSGTIAGLVAITPACGFVSPMGAIGVGLLVSPVCVWAVEYLKHRFGYDDSFDVFGVHGVGAIVGGLLTTVFAAPLLGGPGYAEGRDLVSQFGVQVMLIAFSAAVSVATTFIALKVADLTVGLRVTAEDEMTGLDLTAHGERGYRISGSASDEGVLVPTSVEGEGLAADPAAIPAGRLSPASAV